MGSICHGYMCIVLYMKRLWCYGFLEIYAHLEDGWGQSAMSICALCYIYIYLTLMWCNGFQRSMFDWQRVAGSICLRYMCIVI